MEQPKLPIETRLYFEDLELRRLKSTDGTNLDTITGLAIPYEKRSELLYGFMYEIIRQGAFADCLRAKPDVKCYINHDTTLIVSRTKVNSLTLTETTRGVEFSTTVLDTSYGVDLLKNIDKGNISSMSFGFRADTYDWGMSDNHELRDVKKATLREISFVTNPAYLDTEVMKRSMELLYNELKEHKNIMQQAINKDLENKRRLLELFV